MYIYKIHTKIHTYTKQGNCTTQNPSYKGTS